MKTFFQIRVIALLFLSIFVAAAIMSGCSETPLVSPGSNGGSKSDKDDDDDDSSKSTRKSTASLTCKLPECSSGGKDCCDYEDKDGDLDEDCEDWCKDDLDLSGDAYDKCLALDKEVVEEDLVFLFKKRLIRPEYSELDDLKKDDIELICAAVKHLDSDLLVDRVNKYGKSDAKAMLQWLAEDKTVMEIFDNADDDDGLRMIKKLLETLGTGTSYAGIVNGLSQDVSAHSDKDNIFQLALSSNKKLVDYLHDEIVTNEKEICKDSHRPTPSTSVNVKNAAGTAVAYNTLQPSNGFHLEACILATYCTISKDMTEAVGNEFRKDIADAVNESSIENFIKRSSADGGLGLGGNTAVTGYVKLEENDAEEWTKKACGNLKYLWENKSGVTFFDL